MPFDAQAINIMIASPVDVSAERALIPNIIHEWNAIHALDRNTVLLPIAWETHATPSMGDRPQGIINDQLLSIADILVAVFWTRLGSPTLEADSGTVEEIERHIAAGRPAMIYFSSAPVEPSSIDPDQYKKVTEFKESLRTRGLYEEYHSLADFADKFRRHLSKLIISKFKANGSNQDSHASELTAPSTIPELPTLRKLSQSMLLAAADADGTVLRIHALSGLVVQAGSYSFVGTGTMREKAQAEAAIDELVVNGYLVSRGSRDEVFNVTDAGYELADRLRALSPAPEMPAADAG